MDLLFEAQLFGGLGNGLTIKLQEFVPQVTIFRNGGPAVAVPGNIEADAYPDCVRLGVYELAGPVGPETPIYVSR